MDIATAPGGANVLDNTFFPTARAIFDSSSYPVSNQYSVDFWIRFLDASANTAPIFVESSSTSFFQIRANGFQTIWSNNTNWIRFVSGPNSNDWATWQPNVWTNICLAKRGGNVAVYQDGRLANTSTNQNGAVVGGNSFFSFGVSSNVAVRCQYGPLKIYNVVLDACEVAQNYRAVSPFMTGVMDTSSIA